MPHLESRRVGWVNLLMLVAGVGLAAAPVLVTAESWDHALTPALVGQMLVQGFGAALAWASKWVQSGPKT